MAATDILACNDVFCNSSIPTAIRWNFCVEHEVRLHGISGQQDSAIFHPFPSMTDRMPCFTIKVPILNGQFNPHPPHHTGYLLLIRRYWRLPGHERKSAPMNGNTTLTGDGSTKWFIPDGFWNPNSHGIPSHEAVCILNTSRNDAKVTVTLYFEDREKLSGFHAVVPSERTKHLRMDRWISSDGRPVPADVPYAMVVESNVPVIVQYSRLDTSQSEMALMTTIAYSL